MAAGNNDRRPPHEGDGPPEPVRLPGPSRPSPDHARVIEAMPKALRVARMFARLTGARTREEVEDCEQMAAQKVIEALPRYDSARGPLSKYVWKSVAGAVIRQRRREKPPRRTGEDDALDATEELRARTDPLDDGDEDAKGELLGHCRYVTARRFLGFTRAPLPARPDDILMRMEAFEALDIATGGLEHEEKRFLILRYWESLTWEQVAAAMGITAPQAKGLDRRLCQRLRRDLVRRGVDRAPPDEEP